MLSSPLAGEVWRCAFLNQGPGMLPNFVSTCVWDDQKKDFLLTFYGRIFDDYRILIAAAEILVPV